MAHLSRRLSGNTAGDFFVDSSCIDCDICRQLAPETFHAQAGQTIVARQPRTPDSVHRALMALVACPTGSIGTTGKHPIKAAIAAFPEEIAGGVYFCGFASRHSYGATSYFIVRPGGNVLVDSPRFSPATISPGTRTKVCSPPFTTTVGTRGPSKFARWKSSCRIVSSGCCPDTAGGITPPQAGRCGRNYVPASGGCASNNVEKRNGG